MHGEEVYWENDWWTARYVRLDTPVGTLTHLVPGSLKRKDNTGRAEEEGSAATQRLPHPAAA